MDNGVGRVVMLAVDAEVALPPLVLATFEDEAFWANVEAEEWFEVVGGRVCVGGGLRGDERVVGEDCDELYARHVWARPWIVMCCGGRTTVWGGRRDLRMGKLVDHSRSAWEPCLSLGPLRRLLQSLQLQQRRRRCIRLQRVCALSGSRRVGAGWREG
jgi:hypothetical protein